MDWLNFMLAKMWPHIHETLKQVVAKDLEPKIKDPTNTQICIPQKEAEKIFF